MKLEEFGALIKANELFDHVVCDVDLLSNRSGPGRLIDQHAGFADSIASNIEEGYGRGSGRESTPFWIISRGSAQETRGQYGRMKHWLPEDTNKTRITLCNEIIAILTSTIQTLRSRP